MTAVHRCQPGYAHNNRTSIYVQVTYISNVVSCEQDLSDWLTEMVEQTVPETHQPTLTNRCEGLLDSHM